MRTLNIKHLAAAIGLAFFAFAPAIAQTVDAGAGILAVASRTVTITPTLARIQISMTATASANPADVFTKAATLGLAATDLQTISITPGIPGVPGFETGSVTYIFHKQVPLAGFAAELTKVTQFAAANPDMRTTGALAALVPSDEAIKEAQVQNFGELYREAKARAEQMAADAGLPAGRVLAVTDAYGAAYAVSGYSSFRVPLGVSVRLAID